MRTSVITLGGRYEDVRKEVGLRKAASAIVKVVIFREVFTSLARILRLLQ